MRAAREQPRLVLARVLGAICLVVAGVGLGVAFDHGDTNRTHAIELRFVSAQRSLAGGRAQLWAANARVAHSEDEVRRIRVQARALVRSNRRLRRELATVERKRPRTKSSPHP